MIGAHHRQLRRRSRRVQHHSPDGRTVTLLSRLFVLVAVALLPAIAIQAYNEFDLRRARQVEVENQALSLAKLAAAEQQQIVQGIRQVLTRNVRTSVDKD